MVKKIEKELKARFGSSLTPWEEDGGGRVTSVWRKHSAVLDGRDVTVLVYAVDSAKPQAAGMWSAWKGARSALHLWQNPAIKKHRNHMTLLSSFIDEPNQCIFAVFEKIYPLRDLLHTYCATELLLVLHDIAEGLLLLHEGLDLSHNSLTLAGLYVTASGRRCVVIGDLEFCLAMNEGLDKALPLIRAYRSHLHPEEESAITVTYRGASVWARDSYSTAVILNSVLLGSDGCEESLQELVVWAESASSGMVKQRGSMDANARQGSQILMEHHAVLPPERPSLARLLHCTPFRSCALLKICNGVDTGGSHSFFSLFHEYLAHIPYGVFVDVILPAFLSHDFWRQASGVSVVISTLIGTGSATGSCLERAERDTLTAYLIAAFGEAELRVPMQRVVESIAPIMSEADVMDTVLPIAVQAARRCQTQEDVYWALHAVIVASKELFSRGDSALVGRVAGFINVEVVPLLLQYTQGAKIPTKIRSTALLGFVQLVSLDSCISEGAPGGLLEALSSALLSGDNELCHHALNAVVMAEAIIPYNALALRVLPLTAVVALSPNAKLREKCLQVSSHILQALEEIDEAEQEDILVAPLYHGCELQIPPPDKDKKKVPQVSTTEDHNDTIERPDHTQRDLHDFSEQAMIDVLWNRQKMLHVKGGGRADLRVVTLPEGDAVERATTTTVASKKKRGRGKKKNTATPTTQPLCAEENELNMWERSTFNPDVGEAYSSSAANMCLPQMEDDTSVDNGSSGRDVVSKKKKKKRSTLREDKHPPLSPGSTLISGTSPRTFTDDGQTSTPILSAATDPSSPETKERKRKKPRKRGSSAVEAAPLVPLGDFMSAMPLSVSEGGDEGGYEPVVLDSVVESGGGGSSVASPTNDGDVDVDRLLQQYGSLRADDLTSALAGDPQTVLSPQNGDDAAPEPAPEPEASPTAPQSRVTGTKKKGKKKKTVPQ